MLKSFLVGCFVAKTLLGRKNCTPVANATKRNGVVNTTPSVRFYDCVYKLLRVWGMYFILSIL
jgi:hypothetical protein